MICKNGIAFWDFKLATVARATYVSSYTVKLNVYINPKNWVILSVIQMTQNFVVIATYIGTSNY